MSGYTFRNLVFEGGGVKGIAYIGVLKVLDKKKITPGIVRVGGTSAGAINATLLALGYNLKDQETILKALDFNNFKDGSWIGGNIWRLLKKYGWYKGDFFLHWIEGLIAEKTGDKDTTFEELAALDIGPKLSVIVTNLSRTISEVYSADFTETKKFKVAEAVRMSMSIPLFFQAMDENGETFVDGGVFRNYPIKLFDHRRYILPAEDKMAARLVPYYDRLNEDFPDDSKWPYVYNRQSLGFRLDSKAEIDLFLKGKAPPAVRIKDIISYIKELADSVMNVQEIQHLHSDDWHRTVYVNTLGIGTTDFGLTNKQKEALVKSGQKGAEEYFKWLEGKDGRMEACVFPGNG